MADLHAEAAAVRRQVLSASENVSNLETRARTHIVSQLWKLHKTLGKSVLAINATIHDYSRRDLGSLFRSNTKKTALFRDRIEGIIGIIEAASATTETLYTTTQKFYLVGMDITNANIKPAKESLQTLQRNVSHTQRRLKSDFQLAAASKNSQEQRLESVRREIVDKERSISSNQCKLRENSYEVTRVRDEKQEAERERARKLQEAARLRETAKKDRKKAILVGIFLPIVGWGYTGAALYSASQDESRADEEDTECNSLSSRIISLDISTAQLTRDTSSLENEKSGLEASKRRLNTDFIAQEQRFRVLEAEVRSIDNQLRTALEYLVEAQALDHHMDRWSSELRVILHQMMDLKQKLDSLKAALEEQKYRMATKVKKKAILETKEGRNQMMAVLGKTGNELQMLQQGVQGNSGKFLAQ